MLINIHYKDEKYDILHYVLPLSIILIFDFGFPPTVWYFLFSILSVMCSESNIKEVELNTWIKDIQSLLFVHWKNIFHSVIWFGKNRKGDRCGAGTMEG
jgi:hypothetical protein